MDCVLVFYGKVFFLIFLVVNGSIPSRVYSHLSPSIPGIDSAFTVTLIRIKLLLQGLQQPLSNDRVVVT